jgi:hypothetical protein
MPAVQDEGRPPLGQPKLAGQFGKDVSEKQIR